jgi:LysM repeat protein
MKTTIRTHRMVHLLALAALAMATVGAVPLPQAQTACGPEVIVQSGDTLASIANECGLSVAAIVEANPQIPDPNIIYPGEVINTTTVTIPLTGLQVQLSPTSGLAGTQVKATGNGFPANTLLRVAMAPQGQSVSATSTVSTNANGYFSAQVTIPANAQPGSLWEVTVSSTTIAGPSATVLFRVAASPPAGPYTVVSGDTLSSIALEFGTTVNGLIKANPQITSLAALTPGQQLNIPGSVVVDASSGLTTYFVKTGDYMGQIAARFGVTLAGLEQANPQITTPSLIFPGQRIVIPTALIPISGPHLLLAPVSGPAGSRFQVVAGGFPAETSLPVTLALGNSTPVTTTSVTTNANGSFTLDLTIPSGAAAGGAWQVTAGPTTSGGPTATAYFRVAEIPPAGPYTVQSGDTLSSLAAVFGTSVGALLRANPQITSASPLSVGEQLDIPGSAIAIGNSGESLYIVKSGDSLGGIAAQFGVTLADIEQANPQITDPSLIFPGDHVTIPAS